MPALSVSDKSPAYQVVNPDGRAAILLVCDHASARIPAALGDLGLGAPDLVRHIAWDIGAADATRRMAEALDAPAVLSGYSRLVVDCNRHPTDPTLMAATSDGTAIPGNAGLSVAAREERLAAIYRPYHDAVAAWLADGTRALLSIHSCTPVMNGRARPWHIGVCWEDDRRLAGPALDALAGRGDLLVGDNEPYALDPREDFTVPWHAMRRGLPHIQVEFRQDLVADATGAARWADILTGALAPTLRALGHLP